MMFHEELRKLLKEWRIKATIDRDDGEPSWLTRLECIDDLDGLLREDRLPDAQPSQMGGGSAGMATPSLCADCGIWSREGRYRMCAGCRKRAQRAK